MISEYTYSRAKRLYSLNIPKAELPINVKVVWCDAINPSDTDNLIRVGVHSHTFFEIHFVFHGEVTYRVDGRKLHAKSGQAMFVPPHKRHEYIGKSDDLFKLAVAFRIDGESEKGEQLAAVKKRLFDFSPDIVENTNFMLRLIEKNDVFVPYIISGRLSEIIYSVFRSLDINLPERREGSCDPRFETAIEYISRNITHHITCDAVARECCLSSKQLNRIFLKNMGVSLHKYIVDERVKFAQKMLLQGDKSIKEISIMLGFDEVSNFTSFFKRQCGMSPGAYRENLQ